MNTSRLRGDGGLTLVELLFTVVLLGVISGAIATIMFVFFRTDRSTARSLANSAAAQTLNVWFPADVQSAEPAQSFGIDSAGAADNGCAVGDLASFGTNELRLVLYPGNSPMVVSYRHDAIEQQLVRVTCSDGGSPERQVMVRGVQAADDVDVALDTFELDGEDVVRNVRMTVTITTGGEAESFTLSASPRAVVPVTTIAPGPGGPGPTPTDPCTLVGTSPGVLEMLADNTNGTFDATTVAIERTLQVNVAGQCGADLRISFETRPSYFFGLDPNPVSLNLNATGTAGLWTYAFSPALPGGNWQSGGRPATVERLVGTTWETVGSFVLDARRAPCNFVSGAVTPSPVLLSGTGSNQSVAAGNASTLTVNLEGSCSGVDTRVRYESRPGFLVSTTLNGSGLTRTATISSSTAPGNWSEGTKLVTVERQPVSTWEAFDPAATFEFESETDRCSFLGGTVTPAPVMITTATGGTLSQAVDISVATSDSCGSTLRALVETRGGSQANVEAVSLTPNESYTQWSATLPGGFESGLWSAGQRSMTLQRELGGSWAGFNPAASISFNATNPVCTVLSGTSDPRPVGLDGTSGTSRSLESSFVLHVETNAFCGSRLQAVIETRTSGSQRTGTIELDGGPTQWSISVPDSFQNGRWSAGDREVTVQRRTGNSWTTVDDFDIEAQSAPCRFVNGSVSGQPVLLSGTGGTNRSVIGSYGVNVSTSSTCGTVRVRFDTSPGNTTTLNLSGSGTSRTGSISSSTASDAWSDSPKTAMIEHLVSGQWAAFEPAATIAFNTAQAPCQFVSGSVAGPVYLSSQSSSSQASRSVVGGPYAVTVETTTGCTGSMRASIPVGGSTQTVALTSGNGTNWSGSITDSLGAQNWSLSDKNVRVQRCSGGTCSWTDLSPLTGSAHFTFSTQLACSASGSVPTVSLSRSGFFFVTYSVRNGPYAMTVNTSGPLCTGQFRVQFATGGSGTTEQLALIGTPPSLSAQITNSLNSGDWTPGTKTVTVQQCTASSCTSGSSNWRDIGTFTFQAVYP